MSASREDEHLSRITTKWTEFRLAHAGADAGAAALRAQAELVGRYHKAVYRYLLGATRDEDAAAELSQEFALRFLRGDFHRADPNQGRLRSFVKTALYRLASDYHRRRRRRSTVPIDGEGGFEPVAPPEDDGAVEAEFTRAWREQLLTSSWAALEQFESRTGQAYYTALKLRADLPAASSTELAEAFSARLNKPTTPAAFRQTLHRARERFAELLLAETAQSLNDPSREALESELIALRLWEYCKPAFASRSDRT